MIYTNVPDRAPIRLARYYQEFAWYYPNCEMVTKRWWVQNVKPDWVILDCGANVGYYSILFSQLAPEGKIYAFEPTDTVSMLAENLADNGVTNVDVHKLALGAKSGRRADAIYRIWGSEPERNEVDFVSIDDFVAAKGLTKLDAIKIDVDSFDLEVLIGAEQTLRRFDPYVVVELNHALNKRNQSNAQAFHWLSSIGYREAEVLEYENFVLKRSDNLGSKYPGTPRFELVFT
jgi:FkbM family methyltransferase